MFHGFSQETVDFMWGIRFNNEKSWFELHKADYQTYFLTPMKELGAQVQSALLDRFPQSGLNLKISRPTRIIFGCPCSALAMSPAETIRCSGSSWPPTAGAAVWASGPLRRR